MAKLTREQEYRQRWAKNLKRIRLESGQWDIDRLCKKITRLAGCQSKPVTRWRYYRWERGDGTPTIPLLEPIAKAMDAHPRDLIPE